ncbi:hybrid sensor histidine kinase/response regulator [Marinobacteraceae bacterium S3BR75-40.1]
MLEYADYQAQRERPFPLLRFEPALEGAYQSHRADMLRSRARPVSASALILWVVYCFLDTYSFPASLSEQTVAVRLLVVCPVILSVWFLSFKAASNRLFVNFYVFAYVWGGLSIVLIIFLSRRQGIDMPYDGMLLFLMFGYFLMGLPFWSASIASTSVVAAYLVMEASLGMPAEHLLRNGFFMSTANLIGMVGGWLQEHHQRIHFLDHQMLALSRMRAERDSEQKTRFMTVASHDLRQPLNVVNLLLENLNTEQDENQRQLMLRQLRHSVDHFNRLLGALLDISRLREGMVEPHSESLRVSSVMQAVAETCRQSAQEQGVVLLVEPVEGDPGVRADPILLHRVLQNLVTNALVHGRAEQVCLSARQVQDEIILSVSDDGVGLSEQKQSRIFEAFYRSDEEAASEKGLGLGLTIVKELVELMEGSTGLQSRPGEGCRFWIRLPQTVPPSRHAGALSEAVDETAAAGMPLLLVEDHTETRRWLTHLLGKWGYAVTACASAEEALSAFEGGRFQGVVTDLHMPGMNGAQLVARLRQQAPELGVIVVTAQTADEDSLLQGDRLWRLHKPVAPARLRAALNALRLRVVE